MNSFFGALSLRKMPQPATSEGAINKCLSAKRSPLCTLTFLQVIFVMSN
jgi:hypothetical protein